MKIPALNSTRTSKTSSSIEEKVVNELSQVSSELSELNQYNREKKRSESAQNGSPYLTDRPAYNPTQIFGTEKEKDWKKVSISMEADLKNVDKESAEQKEQYIQNLKHKLNII